MVSKRIKLVGNILNESFVCTHLNGFKYCNLTPIILFAQLNGLMAMNE